MKGRGTALALAASLLIGNCAVFDVNIVECDTTDANIMYNTVVSEYGVRIDCDSAIIKYQSIINSNKYYLYTENQLVDLYTNQSMTTGVDSVDSEIIWPKPSNL